MKKNIIISAILTLLNNGFLFGQNGTGIKLFSYQNSICNRYEDIDRIQNRVAGFNWIGDTCIVELSVVQNCCLVKNGLVEIHHDTLFFSTNSRTFIIENNSDTVWIEDKGCTCNCHFYLTFIIGGIDNHSKYFIYWNNKKIEYISSNYLPAEFTISKYDTIYKYDSQGFSYDYRFYKNGSIHYYWKKKLGYEEFKEFYLNGKPKKNCIRLHKIFNKEEINSCIEWTKHGKLRKIPQTRSYTQ